MYNENGSWLNDLKTCIGDRFVKTGIDLDKVRDLVANDSKARVEHKLGTKIGGLVLSE